MDDKNYYCYRFKGAHGMINLMIPKQDATQEEITKFYQTIVEIFYK